MKIVVTGASGVLGRQIVPRLLAKGCRLLLVGRNTSTLKTLFPGQQSCDYETFADHTKDYDCLIHLATLNTTDQAERADFIDINVNWTLKIFKQADKAGIKRLINMSSTHALNAQNDSHYAHSKRELVQALKIADLDAQTLYLGAVHGDEWNGNLSFLNKLPRPLALVAFGGIRGLKPTTHIDLIVDYIIPDKHTAAAISPTILTDNMDERFIYKLFKSFMDLGFAICVILLFWWLLIIIWISIRLSSPGPGFFKQTRVGRGQKPFTLYKFRTMKAGTVQAGTHEVSAASVTKLGAFLRKSKLDELPQVINILKNEISLIGPRPCLPIQEELVQERRARDVFSLKPGITGLAQIHDIDMSAPERLARKDYSYLKLRSILADISIFVSTLKGGGRGDRTSH